MFSMLGLSSTWTRNRVALRVKSSDGLWKLSGAVDCGVQAVIITEAVNICWRLRGTATSYFPEFIVSPWLPERLELSAGGKEKDSFSVML
jgi:hypothetical protein